MMRVMTEEVTGKGVGGERGGRRGGDDDGNNERGGSNRYSGEVKVKWMRRQCLAYLRVLCFYMAQESEGRERRGGEREGKGRSKGGVREGKGREGKACF